MKMSDKMKKILITINIVYMLIPLFFLYRAASAFALKISNGAPWNLEEILGVIFIVASTFYPLIVVYLLAKRSGIR